MDGNVVALVLGLSAVIAITSLLLRAQGSGGTGEAAFTFAEIFSASVKFGPEETTRAGLAVREAAQQKGVSGSVVADVLVETTTSHRLARVLWVDDNPDNNIYETVALENLGCFVTKATTTEAALAYLSQLDFAVVITDLGRDGDPEAGIDFIRRARGANWPAPIVVYTAGAGPRRLAALEAGAAEVVELPDEFLVAVTDHVGRTVPAGQRRPE